MLRGATKRTALDADAVTALPPARGVAQLRREAAVWVIVDEADRRKPHARAMAGLQRGKRALTAIGDGVAAGAEWAATWDRAITRPRRPDRAGGPALSYV